MVPSDNDSGQADLLVDSKPYGRPSYPHFARLIQQLAEESRYWVTREELAGQALLDPTLRSMVAAGAAGSSKQLRDYAANMVDWWSADYTKNTSGFEEYVNQFSRTSIDEKFAYWPLNLGPEPRVRQIWICNAPWLERDEHPSEMHNSSNLHWNLWSTKMLPYNDITVGDLIVTAWNETKYRKRGKRFGWVIEVDHLITSEYASKDEVYSKIKKEMPEAVDFTKREFLEHPYTERGPDSGYLLASSGTARFLIDRGRPESLKISSHGWRSWTETELQGLRFERLLDPSPRMWQVNNNENSEWELASGLLFAHQATPSGAKMSGHHALCGAKPGDVVFAMFDTKIGARGIVVESYRDVASHETSGDFNGPGFELKVQFDRVRSPFRPKDHLDTLEKLWDPAPDRNPLTKDGGAKQPRYFTEIAESHGAFYESLINDDVVGSDRHILVHWPVERPAAEAIDEMRRILEANRESALILGDAHLSNRRLAFYSKLLASGKTISVFLLAGQSEQVLVECNLVSISNDPTKLRENAIPTSQASAVNTGNTCFLLDSIGDALPVGQLDTMLVIESEMNVPLSQYLTEGESVMEVLKVSTDKPSGLPPSASSLVRQLAEDLTWPVATVFDLLDGIENRRPQIILTGPPGTGKTYCADLIARALLSVPDKSNPNINAEEFIHLVQFHPTYSYQQFIVGQQPKPSENGMGFEFVWEPGVLSKIVTKIENGIASGVPQRHVLIIDEINRANVPSVFGELMYLLEYRNRSVTLGSGKQFSLPDDLMIIGTMNSADRSIRGLDLALRRRFDFFEVPPDSEILRKHYADGGRGTLEDLSIGQLVEGFEELNRKIGEDSGSQDLLIGHSYFMERVLSRASLHRIWRQQLSPLIREYFLGSPDITRGYSVEKFWKA